MKIHNPLCSIKPREKAWIHDNESISDLRAYSAVMVDSESWFVRDSIDRCADNWAKLLTLSIYGVTSSSSACTAEGSALEYNLNQGIMRSATTFFCVNLNALSPTSADINQGLLRMLDLELPLF